MIRPAGISRSAAIFIAAAFDEFDAAFSKITARAPKRFVARDWAGMAADAEERLDIYGESARRTSAAVTELLGTQSHDKGMWSSIRSAYTELISGRPAKELAETFFNSITRRTFVTVGVDREIEFVDADFEVEIGGIEGVCVSRFDVSDLRQVIRAVLDLNDLSAGFADLEMDLDRVVEEIQTRIGEGKVDRVDLARDVFYRGKGAYLVGRLFRNEEMLPIAIALVHKKRGISIDAILLSAREVSVLFSFAHSYFHVEEPSPARLVRFIQELVPRKRRSELYISLGRSRHGKTELYREIRRHLETNEDKFVTPPGKEGLVMSVFTLPGFEMVFKVIKDAFPPQKTMTPSQVMEKYRLVFHHDRAGRLVDSQSFEHLQFGVHQFDSDLLTALERECSRSVRVADGMVDLSLTYVQRRVIPLDVYIRSASKSDALAAVIDYGNAIRDLAVTGIFPGDLLIKNFGVTRNERVVFYDYDELCEISECRFRELPVAASIEDEMSATPWFPLGPDDVFPSEFGAFLGLAGDLRDQFLSIHADLFKASWWNKVKKRVESGDMVSIYPYDTSRRLTNVRQ